MKAFVTGGTGFVGGHLVKRLIRDGVSVKALVRDLSKADELKNLGVEIVTGDTTDKASLQGVMRGCDVLYHLGNVARWWIPDKSMYFKINVEGTKNTLFEALKENVKKVIYTSSLAAIRQPKGRSQQKSQSTKGILRVTTEGRSSWPKRRCSRFIKNTDFRLLS